MKECRYCGSSCDDEVGSCSNCGGTKFLSEEEIALEQDAEAKYLEEREKYNRRRKKVILRLAAIACGIVAALIVSIALLTNDGSGKVTASTGMDKAEIVATYETANAYLEQGDYANAIAYFSKIQGYEDVNRKIGKAQEDYREQMKPEILAKAQEQINNNEYDKAIATLEAAQSSLPGDTGVAVLLDNAKSNKVKHHVWLFESDDSQHSADGYAEIIGYMQSESAIVSADVELSAKQNEFISAYRGLLESKRRVCYLQTADYNADSKNVHYCLTLLYQSLERDHYRKKYRYPSYRVSDYWKHEVCHDPKLLRVSYQSVYRAQMRPFPICYKTPNRKDRQPHYHLIQKQSKNNSS